MTSDIELLKTMHSSLCIRFGTTVPYALGPVRAERVGYASIPTVAVEVMCRSRNVPDLVPLVRQRVYGELAERGWTPDDIEFSPTVGGSYRRRRFVETNPESDSYRSNKFGCRLVFHWEMGKELAAATFKSGGSFKPLPERGDA